MLNKVILQGRLTSDIEVRKTANDKSVASFSIAVQRNVKSSDGNAMTDFVDCIAWSKTADFLHDYFHRGNQLLIEGELQTRTWEDKNKQKRKAIEVNVTSAYFVESKSSASESKVAQKPATKQTVKVLEEVKQVEEPEGFGLEELGEDGLPF